MYRILSYLSFLLLIIICFVLGIVIINSSKTTKGFVTALINHPSEKKLSFSYPTLDTIFSDNHSWIATLSAENKVTLIATGDIIPARSVNYQVVSRNNPRWPYEKTADFIRNADITFINLETPLIRNCATTQEGMVFCGTDKNIEGLVYAGVDVASLANNHAGNYGKDGVENTVKLLAENGISATGVRGPLYKVVRGVTFAFLGYNDVTKVQPGVENAEKKLIAREISEAKAHSDIVIVTYHWGTEYQAQPDESQKELGHFTIDSGADLVIGNHPHWIQPVELYHGKLITYAHGNFVFDQMWSLKTRQGVVGRYTFYDKQLVDVEYFPLLIESYGQPFFLSGEEKTQLIQEMKQESIKLMGVQVHSNSQQ